MQVAPEASIHPRGELDGTVWPAEAAVCAHLESSHDEELIVPATQHQDRHLRGRTQPEECALLLYISRIPIKNDHLYPCGLDIQVQARMDRKRTDLVTSVAHDPPQETLSFGMLGNHRNARHRCPHFWPKTRQVSSRISLSHTIAQKGNHKVYRVLELRYGFLVAGAMGSPRGSPSMLAPQNARDC